MAHSLSAHARVRVFHGFAQFPGKAVQLQKQGGVYLHKKVGDKVEQGEPLFTIYAEFNADFTFAKNAAMNDNSYQIEHL